MEKVWIAGASGQIGRALNEVLDPLAMQVLNTDLDELDIADTEAVLNFGEVNRPDVIINCAAVTDTKLCEENPELAYRVNALGARNLSIVAKNIGAKVVQISTDDVFDGLASAPYNEFDFVNPKSIYGRSKHAGENYVKEFTHKHFIIRSNWVYGKGENFVNRVLTSLKSGETFFAAVDQYGSPTSAADLARIIAYLIETNEYGTYHVTCKGTCSRYEFAEEIARLAGGTGNIRPVASKDLKPAPARPDYVVLDNFILRIIEVYSMPEWKDSLAEYLNGLEE